MVRGRGKKDVPKQACYVGRYCDCYVWVCPENREALSQFTLSVLKLATAIKEVELVATPGAKYSPGYLPPIGPPVSVGRR